MISAGAPDRMEPLEGGSRHMLRTGVLNLKLNARCSGYELFRIAERINPKRSFLFVSTVLGRHIPVRPKDHFAAVDGIVNQVSDLDLDGTVLVMGYAETAVGVGAAVARRIAQRRPDLSVLYLSTTRHPVDDYQWVTFSEGHSHATAHHVLSLPEQGLLTGMPVTLVLVDDETTTGSTFLALFRALQDGGLPIGRVLLLTLLDWSGGAALRSISEIAPALTLSSFSLTQGQWSWERDPRATLPEVPAWHGSAGSPVWKPDQKSDPLLRAPRLGLHMSQGAEVSPLAELLGPRFSGEPILVIGTGEHVWGPMLLAERLEFAGANVRVVATTRSPVIQGDVVCHKVTFSDHFGIGVPMYLHNVPPHPQARVIIMTETSANGICSDLRDYLGRGQIVDGAGLVTEFGTT